MSNVQQLNVAVICDVSGYCYIIYPRCRRCEIKTAD